MHPSTARRERLVSPLNLALMAGLFVVAFFLLKPDSDLAGTSSMNAGNVDELQLAYLRAQNLAGKSSDAEVIKVIQDLVNAGRSGQAKNLLLDYPDLAVTDTLRFRIDLELAAVASDVSLFSALDTLTKTPRLHDTSLLERATELSRKLEHPQTSLALYEAWAFFLKQSDTQTPMAIGGRQVAVYRKCAEHMAAIQLKEHAVTCYERALDVLPESISPVALQLALLEVQPAGGYEQRQLLDTLMQNDNASTEQLSSMAPVMLAIQRPDLAYRLYARLALKDSDSASRWLPEAARWAQAAGRPADAAVFIESLARGASPAERPILDEQVERLLIQAGKRRSAYVRLRSRIERNPDDAELLARGVSLARQVGEPAQALHWNAALLSLQPDNEVALSLQSDLALAVGDLTKALSIAQQRVEANSTDLEARTLLARVSEWNGKPLEALEQWLWLAEGGRGATTDDRHNALREVVRLSGNTWRPSDGSRALRELTLLEPPSRQDILQLVSFYVLDGRPGKASIALRDIMALHGSNAFTLRTLAVHEYQHNEYLASLDAWNHYARQHGHSVEATLARIELLWRLDRKDEAMEVTPHLKGKTLVSQATDYQLRVMAEIGWRYRMPWLMILVQPRIDALDVEDQRTLYGRRSLAVLQDSGDDEKAMRESIKLWGNTGQADFALLAMRLAVKVDDKPVITQFSPEQRQVTALHTSPAYWSQVASIRLREGNSNAARHAYERALNLDPEHIESVAGLLWLAIGEQDEVLLQSTLTDNSALAQNTPALWQAMAIGYLQLGAASTSVAWFDRLLDQIDADYGMLLTYADALEYAGKSSDARKVRQYALQQLRPILIEGSADEQTLLLRQYARLSTRYDSTESNEALIDYLLDPASRPAPANDSGGTNSSEDLWREDMAISWLMSTQQYEHARLVMAQIHAKRLEAPAWQQLAIALKDKNTEVLESIVQARGSLSIGNHILALRQLGKESRAYALTQNALAPGAWLPGSNYGDRQVAREQYVSLRNSRPSFVSGVIRGRSAGGLSTTDSGVDIRHSFANTPLGLSVSAYSRQYDSSQYQLEGTDEQTNISLSLFYAGSSQYARLTTGINSMEQGDQSYASGRYAVFGGHGRRELSAEIAYNEAANYSPELTIAGAQNRATFGLDADFGRRQFLRLRADVTEINTRLEQRKVATGLGGSIELGVRGSFGSNSWSTSVSASQVRRERETVLPEALRLSRNSSMNSVLAAEVQRLSVGASLSRGGVNTDFPQVSSPRYYVNSSLGQNWPEQVIGFQIDAGAGIRVLGGDELSFSVSHDTQPTRENSGDATALGMQYRYHFQ